MEANQPVNEALAGSKESNGDKSAVNETTVITKDTSEINSAANMREAVSPAAFRSTRRRESPPPFLLKVYDIVEDRKTDLIVSWNADGTSFIVHDPHRFAAEILNNYFRHNNLSSFVCQLNTYLFKKISWDKLEFQHEWFRRGEKSLLKNIRRRNQNQNPKNLQQSRSEYAAAELEMSELMKVFEDLRHEHDILMAEIKELREWRENAEEQMDVLKKRAECSLSKLQKVAKYGCSQIAKKCRLEGAETESESAIEVQDDVLMDVGSSELMSLEKQLMEDLRFENLSKEDIAKVQSGMVIEMEDLIEGPADWKEHIKELLGKANK